MLLGLIFFLPKISSAEESVLEFNYTAPLSVAENSLNGTEIGNFKPTGKSNGAQLSYSVVPSLPVGLSPRLWLDASELDWAGRYWQDKSEHQKHAEIQGSAHGYPYLKIDQQNGHSVMRYPGINDAYHSFDEISNIRTAFWVISKSENSWGMLLGNSSGHPFHFGHDSSIFHHQYSLSAVRNGILSINGNEVDGTNTPFPSELSIISLQLSGEAKASNFSMDRGINGRFFKGDLGELILFDQALNQDETKAVESYLHRKWDLPLAYPPVLPPFSVSEDGVVSANRSFDYEELSQYPLRVKATDTTGRSVVQTFHIAINDVIEDMDQDGIQDAYDIDIDGDGSINDFEISYGTDPRDPASVNRSPSQLRLENQKSVVENTPAGFVIGQFQADDEDQDALSFSVSGNNFIIEQNGTLRTARSFDHELEPAISVTLTATDPRGASNSVVFSIEVLDLPNDLDEDGVADSVDPDRDGDGMSNSDELVNHSDPDDPTSINYAPTDLNSTTALTIIENRPANTIVGQFSAADQESPDSMRFALVSGQGDYGNGLFSLDANGTLRSLNPFDFEINATQYSIRVAVYDEQNASMESSFEIDLLDEDTFSPISLDRNLMLWLDASDRATLDRGEFMGELGTPEDGEQVKFWADKSGKEYHAKSIEGAATYKSEEVLGNPTVYFQNNTFEVQNSSEDFDGWDKMTVLLVLEQKSRYTWQAWIGKWNQVNNTTNSSWHFLGRRPDMSPPLYSFRINGTSATDRIDLSNNQTPKLFNPSLLTLSFGDNQRRVFLNGTSALTAEDNGSILSTSFPVTIGGEADKGGFIKMNFSEILIFNDALDDNDRQRVEGYLAHKWNLLQEFDDYHPYKNVGMMDGSSIAIAEELAVGTPIIQLSELDPDYNASWTYSLVSPSETNDNQFFQLQDHDPFSPKEFEGLSLWLDASTLTTTPATWADLSDLGNDANKIGSPSVVTNSHNGLTLMNYNANGQRHKFPMLEDIRTVFWVISQDASVNGSGFRYLLTRSTSGSLNPDWHNNNNGKLYGGYTNANIKNGVTRMDGTVINGTVTNYPNNLSIISVRTTGNCIADSFGYDRGHTTRQWIGNLGELIIYNEPLTDQQIELIEVYLANKWNIGHSSPNFSTIEQQVINYASNYTLQTGSVFDYETNSTEYRIQIAGTSGSVEQSEKEYKIYISNVVEDMDGDGIEDHYDLDVDGDGFSDLIEIAYPSDPKDPDSMANVAPHQINFTGDLSIPENLQVGSQVTTFSATDDDGDLNFTYSIPKTIEKLEPVLWLDANHPSAKSSTWEDLSTYNRDAIRYNTPTVIENAQNGLSVMRYQARSTGTDHHQWSSVNNIRTVFAVLKRNSGHVLAHSSSYHFHSNGNRILHSSNAKPNLRQGITRLNGLEIEATTTDFPGSQFFILSFIPSPTTTNISANRIGKDRNLSGNHFDGDYGELILFDKELDDWEIESVEYSLTRKWGLESNLAESHLYKDADSTNGNNFFSLDNDGALTLAQPIDYETDRNFSITVRATDPYGASFDKLFTIEVTDIPEDLDGDGTPDHLDNDIDNDGLSNADELIGKSDPYNSNSTNRPPNAITSSNLSFAENLATGTKIGEFSATDPDGNENHTFSLYPLLEVSPSLWLDGTDIDGNLKPDTYAVGANISLWVDKSGNGYDFNETKGQPKYSDKEGKGVVKFDGQTMIWSGNSLSPDFNNFTIMSVARYTGGKNGRIISDVSKNWFFGFHSSGLDLFFANGHLANSRDIPVDQNWHLHVGTINSNDFGQGWVDQINMVDSPNGAGSYYQPRLLGLGGWRRSSTWFDEMSKAEVAELLVFDWVLNTSEIKQAEDYLIGKWNLPLPTGNAAVDFFEIDQNGSLFTKRAFNFETNDHNYSLRVRVTDDYGAYKEEDFLIQLTNILEDADGNGVEDYDGNQNLTPTNIELSGGALTVTENAELGTVVGQVQAIDLDGDIFHHYSLSTSADHQRFHPSKIDGLTAWFDASDTSTISTYADSSELYTWRNKVDPDSYLRPNHGREPDANATINGLNAISFQKNDKQMEFLKGWKNHEEWNPAGENGKTSGANDDAAIFLIHQSKVSKRSAMPFGFGWGGHFLWHNGIHFDPNRISTGGIQVGKTHLIALYNSIASNQRGIWVDGNLRISGSPFSRNISGAFFFPDKHNESLDYASDCLLGEIMVIRGVMEERDHLEIEGYLAHKWGLADALPQSHMYSKSYGHFADSDPFLNIDKNGTIRTATTFDYEIDSNLTITVRATDDDGFSTDKNFTVMIENVQESDLDNDGIEDLIDDDIDGDGVSNTDEWKNNSDPLNPNSLNRAPTDIQASTLSFKENKTAGSTILSFTTDDPDEGQTHRYRLTSNGKMGWRTSHLTGDKNSGINSNRAYTCAVNINGDDQVVGGVTFKGEEETYGQGWEITDGFTNLSPGQQSTVNGKIGKMLSDGMRWNGESQKIKLTGLTTGKKYVFSLYSQAWGTGVKKVIISCSDLDESLTINQNIFGASQNDGLLIECTYIAKSVSTEFSIEQISGGTWHLYAFSNHEALPFSLEENGELRVDRVFDYETEEKNYTLHVLTTDDYNLSFIKEFTLTLENEIEDLDGDLVENHEDSDIDGDGVSNEMELAYGTDPWDKASVNEPPSQLFSSQTLQIYENSPVGTLIGRVEGIDPQGASTLEFSMLPVYPNNIKPMVWLDGEEAGTLEKEEIQGQQKIRRWKNKAGNRHDFIQNENNNKPHFDMAGLNGFSTVRFEENNFVHSEGILPVGENFSVILVSKIENVNTTQDALFSLGSKSGGPQFDFLSQKSDAFMGYFSTSKMGENHTFFQENQNGAAIYELSFNFDQQKVECRLNGFNQGTTSYNAPPDPLHIFRLNANLEVTDFTEGEIAEFFIFNHLLTEFERRKVEKYLSSKWSIPVHNPLPDHHFKMNSEGFIYTTKSFDFEQDQLSAIKVKVIDDQNLSLTQEFEISLLNVIEDRDGDGIEDAYDFDFDNDGIEDAVDSDDDNDGFPDSYEIAYGSDPHNANSVANKFPTALYLNGSNIVENSPLNTVVGKLVTEEPDLSDTFSYTLISGEGSDSNALFTLSTDGILKTAYLFDHEDRKDHSIRVRVEDQFGASLENSFSLTIDNLYLSVAVTHPHTEGASEVLFKGEILENGGEAPESFGIQLSSSITFENAETLLSSKIKGKFFSITKRELALARTYYYRAFAINSEGTAYGAIMRFYQPGPDWWLDLSPETTKGWIIDSWMGSMQPYPNQWAYHRRLGWIFMSPDGSNGYWLWRQENGWLWTNSSTWPFLWSHSRSNWLYLWPENNTALFYDYGRGSVR